MITPAQITAVLDRYAVRHHWRASRAASTAATGRLSRYAVFTEGRQVSEPATHAQACAEARRLTVADLLALLSPSP